jgi:hypothetical protein
MATLVAEGQDPNERAHMKLEAAVGLPYYDNECKQSTRFFQFDHDNVGLRPTVLHFACLVGKPETIRKLMELGCNPKLKCWFGKRVPAFNCDGIVSIEANCGDITRLCRQENIYRRIYKMTDLGFVDWKVRCERIQHECDCAIAGTDPDQTDQPFYD